jgi:hypothetical protein
VEEKKRVQYTIRDIPETTDARLREAAAAEETSLNTAALHALERGLGLEGKPVRYRNLRPLVNRPGEIDRKAWSVALSEMDKVNPEEWR